MNNKKVMYLVGGVVVLLILVSVTAKVLIARTTQNNLSATPAKNDAKVENRITWNQKQLSAAVFTTREDPEGQELEDKQMVHIVFTSFFNVSSDTPMKSFSVTNAEFKQGIGTPIFVMPSSQTSSTARSYIYTNDTDGIKSSAITDGGKTYNAVITKSVPTRFNELQNIGGFPNFAFISKNLGTVSEQSIMNSESTYDSGKVLQYLHIKPEQLNGNITVNFNITFEDGKTYAKQFKGTIDGTKLMNSPFYQIDMVEQ